MPTKLSPDKKMMASKLKELLEEAITKYGDLPVYLRDPDTSWALNITFDPEAKELTNDREYPELKPCMSINADYYD